MEKDMGIMVSITEYILTAIQIFKSIKIPTNVAQPISYLVILPPIHKSF